MHLRKEDFVNWKKEHPTVFKMREQNFTMAKIGERFGGLSRQRIQQIIKKYEESYYAKAK